MTENNLLHAISVTVTPMVPKQRMDEITDNKQIALLYKSDTETVTTSLILLMRTNSIGDTLQEVMSALPFYTVLDELTERFVYEDGGDPPEGFLISAPDAFRCGCGTLTKLSA